MTNVKNFNIWKQTKKEMNSDIPELEAICKDFNIWLKELCIPKNTATINYADLQTAGK